MAWLRSLCSLELHGRHNGLTSAEDRCCTIRHHTLPAHVLVDQQKEVELTPEAELLGLDEDALEKTNAQLPELRRLLNSYSSS